LRTFESEMAMGLSVLGTLSFLGCPGCGAQIKRFPR
jgi:hypothetical protein